MHGAFFPPRGLGPTRVKAAAVPAPLRAAAAALAGGQALSQVLPQTQANLAGKETASLSFERGEKILPPKNHIFKGVVPGAAGPPAPSYLHEGGNSV